MSFIISLIFRKIDKRDAKQDNILARHVLTLQQEKGELIDKVRELETSNKDARAACMREDKEKITELEELITKYRNASHVIQNISVVNVSTLEYAHKVDSILMEIE